MAGSQASGAAAAREHAEVSTPSSGGRFVFRTRVFDADLFGTHGIAEIAPFAEAGRVFRGMSENPLTDLHPVGGVGFRAIAEPFVVGYVDVGYGGEGTAVFSGINYPF